MYNLLYEGNIGLCMSLQCWAMPVTLGYMHHIGTRGYVHHIATFGNVCHTVTFEYACISHRGAMVYHIVMMSLCAYH